MECPKCGGKTMVDVTRPVNSEEGPQQVFRQRRCVDSVCRFRFVTTEEWQAVPMSYPNWRALGRARAKKRAQARGADAAARRDVERPRF